MYYLMRVMFKNCLDKIRFRITVCEKQISLLTNLFYSDFGSHVERAYDSEYITLF